MSKLVPIIVVVAVVAAGGGYMYMQGGSSKPAPIPDQVIPASENAPRSPGASVIIDPTAAPQAASYKDGTYTADGSYKIPEEGKSESISVSLTLKGGVVTDSTIKQEAVDHKSVLYQEVFAQGYKEFVVGKKIDEIKVDVVSGSSLTSIGFNEAVSKIKTQAKA